MILGSVNANREAVIEIAVVGDNKRLKSVRAVVDTGFTGDLTLPRAIIAELGLTWRGIQEGILGDGSVQDFDMYVASVIWDGEIRRIEVNAAEMGSLVGMGLLEGYKLEIEAIDGGCVKITALFSNPIG